MGRTKQPQYFPRFHGARCDECPLKGSKTVGPSGPKNPKLIVIGEAPGVSEEREGKPFWGPTGGLLKAHLRREHNLSSTQVYKTNATCCRIPKTMSKGDASRAVECCRPRLRKELANLPKVPTVAMGSLALLAVTGDKSTITKWWGTYFAGLDGRKIWAAHHPAFLFRSPAYTGLWNEVIRRALADEEYIPWPRYVNSLTDEVMEAIRSADMVGYDVETAGDAWKNLLCFGFATKDLMVSVLPTPENLSKLEDLWRDPSITWIGQAGNHDRLTNWFAGLPAFQAGKYHDTFIAHCIVFPQIKHNLGDIAAQYGVYPRWKSEFGSDGDEKGAEKFAKADVEERAFYNAADAWLTRITMEQMLAQLEESETKQELYAQSSELYDISLKMQMWGIEVDFEMLAKKEEEADRILEEKKNNLAFLAPELENPNSSEQVRQWLSRRMTWDKKTDKGVLSTDKAVLTTLLGQAQGEAREFLANLLDYRHYAQQRNLYLNPIRKWQEDSELLVDGRLRLHPSWQLGTKVVGRGTCKKPNLQQVTGSFRPVYRARPGNKFTWADYQQFHLYIIAWLSGDENMVAATQSGDMHTAIGKMIFEVDPLPKALRTVTKTLDLGWCYGGQAQKLWEQTVTKMPKLAADLPDYTLRFVETICKKMEAKFEGVVKWQEEAIERGRLHGFAECPLNGRRYYFFDRVDPPVCLNFPVQGTEAEVANRAVIGLAKEVDWETSALVLQCHDEIGLEGPDTEEEAALREELLRKYMCQTLTSEGGTVTFPIDVTHGYNWEK